MSLPEHTQVLSDSAAVAAEAAALILHAADAAIAERGAFHLVLAGGRTPEAAYRLLAGSDADWPNWHIWYGDERCLPVDDAERNSVMAARAWLAGSAIPAAQQHPMAAELGAEAAAAQYADAIAAVLPFDMVLLGMGEDGHTASLFPGQSHAENERVHAVHDSPKPPPDRVSLSVATISSARAVLMLVTGAGKRDALRRWRAGEKLPIATVALESKVQLLLDEVAANA